MKKNKDPAVAFIIPCFNEEKAIERVIQGCRKAVSYSKIYVFDNNSTDRTAEIARNNGAHVIGVLLQGKGNVVRRMFADVEADFYIMLDGDATYDLNHIQSHLDRMITEGHDMVVGLRIASTDHHFKIFRKGHRFGNILLTAVVAKIFGRQFFDMLSGYRLFSRRFVKSFPASAQGFEIETELTVHALELRMPCVEIPVAYYERPDGSFSKLSTYRDGYKILKTIFKLILSERPLGFFSLLSFALFVIVFFLGYPLIDHYMKTGLVPRIPTAILLVGIVLIAMLCLLCGIVLQNVTLGRQEQKRLVYLSIPGSGVIE